MQVFGHQTRQIVTPRPRAGRASLVALAIGGWIAVAPAGVQTSARQAQPAPARSTAPQSQAVLDKYCITCHNQRLRTAGLALDTLDLARPANAEVWEKVIAKLRAGSMPPPGRPRPDAATYHAVASELENTIDRAWSANPNPGRISAVHRLNRTEYNNAIRDLFALDIDVKPLLPGDETADGSFDNFADSLSIATAHLERYMSIARQVTRLATGLPPTRPTIETYEIPLHVIQDDRQSEDLPLGSRGGMAIHHDFPVDGEYLIKVRLQRQYQDYLKGMGWPQQLDVRLDARLLNRFTVGGGARGRPAATSYAGDGEPNFAGDPEWEKYMQVDGDAGLEIRVQVSAGPHLVGVSFVRELWEPEGLPQPLQRGRVITDDNVYMNHASVGSVQIGGPYKNAGPAKDTPGRRSIFVCQPRLAAEERACATKILSRVARLAYRRPVVNRDVQTLVEFFDTGRRDGGSFDAGIQFALERMLVDPDFLLRVHRDPPSTRQAASAPASSRLSDIEIASRIASYELAFRMQSAGPELLDFSKETPSTLEMYGINDEVTRPFAANCLLARRLAERGVRFIQLYSGGGPLSTQWDAHDDINANHESMSARVDKPIAAMLHDLKERGLLDSTLVVWASEFGRTPMSQGGKGRDHNPYGYTMWMAGGGVKGGQAFGTTDEFGLNAVTDRVSVHDFHATILHLLGLDHEKLTYPHNSRDERLTDVSGQVIKQILA